MAEGKRNDFEPQCKYYHQWMRQNRLYYFIGTQSILGVPFIECCSNCETVGLRTEWREREQRHNCSKQRKYKVRNLIKSQWHMDWSDHVEMGKRTNGWKWPHEFCLTSIALSEATSIIEIFMYSLHISSFFHRFHWNFLVSFIDEKFTADSIRIWWGFITNFLPIYFCVLFLHSYLCIWNWGFFWIAFASFPSFLAALRSSSTQR